MMRLKGASSGLVVLALAIAFSDTALGLTSGNVVDGEASPISAAYCYEKTTFDSGSITGLFSSVTIGMDGLPVIAYYEGPNEDLKVAHCSDAACSSATFATVDSEGDVGWYTSIAIGTDGLPIISYYDGTNSDLKVAHCNDAACSSATVTSIDGCPGMHGKFNSIAIGGDGLPIIAYFDQTICALKAAHCLDYACSSSTRVLIDGTGCAGSFASMAIGADGLPIISYHDSIDGDLKVAHCDNAYCLEGTVVVVDSSESTGYATSIAVGTDGLPIISYYDYTNAELKVAHCDDAACLSATISTIASAGDILGSSSIAIGADGLPVISYHDCTDSSLRVAFCTDAACSSAILAIVDSSESVGSGNSVAIGMDGLPIISYYGTYPDPGVKVAKAIADSDCILFADDFYDGYGSPSGDPDWDEVSGDWKVCPKTHDTEDDPVFLSRYNRRDKAVVNFLTEPLVAASVASSVKLTGRSVGKPNAALLFAYQDKRNYRYVRATPQKIVIGQAGDFGGEVRGVKAKLREGLDVGMWGVILVDIYPDGSVKVYRDSRVSPALVYKFETAVAGKIGVMAVKTRSLFDDFSIWAEEALP